jgi:hypothetical protein
VQPLTFRRDIDHPVAVFLLTVIAAARAFISPNEPFVPRKFVGKLFSVSFLGNGDGLADVIRRSSMTNRMRRRNPEAPGSKACCACKRQRRDRDARAVPGLNR